MKKIKVAHIITRMIIGGAQENTLYTVQGLQKDPRSDVCLITGPTYGPEGNLLEDMAPEGIRIEVVSALRRNINPFLDLKALFQIKRLLEREQFDIVHTHSAKAGILGRLAAKMCKCRVIIHTIHGLAFHQYENFFKNQLYIFLERSVTKFTDKVITVCDEMIRQCMEVNIAAKEKFQTIYSGLDIESFTQDRREEVAALKKRLGISEDTFVIGKIGRLFHLKGHKYLLEAAKEVVKEAPHVVFLFVGGGILAEDLKKQAKELGIEKHIIFTGLASTLNMPIFLQAMDMVVHVSLREGLPRVIPQAFLAKKPVVAFDIDGARDIITDSVNGYLVEPKNISLLADRILKLVKSSALREAFDAEGYTFALENFSKEKMVHDIDRLYQQFL